MSEFQGKISFGSSVENALPRMAHINVVENGIITRVIDHDSIVNNDYSFDYEGEGFTLEFDFKPHSVDERAKKFIFDVKGRRLHRVWWDRGELIQESWFAIIPKSSTTGCTYLFDTAHGEDNLEDAGGYFSLGCKPTPIYEHLNEPGAVRENLNVSYDINVNVFKSVKFERLPMTQTLMIDLN